MKHKENQRFALSAPLATLVLVLTAILTPALPAAGAIAQDSTQPNTDVSTKLKIRRAMTRSRFMEPVAPPQAVPAQAPPPNAVGGAPIAGPGGQPVYAVPELPQIVLPPVRTGPGLTVVNGCGDISIGAVTDGENAPREQIIHTGDIIQICRRN